MTGEDNFELTSEDPDPSSADEGERGAAADGPQSRSLMIREGGDKGMSLAETAALVYYKLTWRMPLHKLRLRGQAPMRLLAAPNDPVPGNEVRGMAIRAGHFLFRGLKQPLDTIDFAELRLPPGYENYVHRFRWLRDLAEVVPHEKGASAAEHLVSKWLDANGGKIKEPAWRPDNCGWRLLLWATHAPYILSSDDSDYRASVLNHMARSARHLDRTADKAPAGLPRLAAWIGVVAASILLPDGKARRVVGEAGLGRAIDEFFYADGGTVSRAPLAQMEAIILLSMLRQCYASVKEDMPEFAATALTRAVPAMLSLTHSDGSLGSWQGSGPVAADYVAAVVEGSAVRARPLRQARDWGYQRVSAGRSILQLDAAPPPTARVASVGCASTLAFEFSSGDHRIIVNCGGAALVGATLPAKLAFGLRSTAAHSTLCLEDSNSTSVVKGGKLGRGVGEVELERRDVDKATRIEASHDGYLRSFGLTHKRLLLVRSDGLEIRGEDMLIPGEKKHKRDDVEFAVRFHLGLNIEADQLRDGKAIILRLPDASVWQFRVAAFEVALEDSIWVDRNGRPHSTKQMVIKGSSGKGGANVGWLLKNMG